MLALTFLLLWKKTILRQLHVNVMKNIWSYVILDRATDKRCVIYSEFVTSDDLIWATKLNSSWLIKTTSNRHYFSYIHSQCVYSYCERNYVAIVDAATIDKTYRKNILNGEYGRSMNIRNSFFIFTMTQGNAYNNKGRRKIPPTVLKMSKDDFTYNLIKEINVIRDKFQKYFTGNTYINPEGTILFKKIQFHCKLECQETIYKRVPDDLKSNICGDNGGVTKLNTPCKNQGISCDKKHKLYGRCHNHPRKSYGESYVETVYKTHILEELDSDAYIKIYPGSKGVFYNAQAVTQAVTALIVGSEKTDVELLLK